MKTSLTKKDLTFKNEVRRITESVLFIKKMFGAYAAEEKMLIEALKSHGFIARRNKRGDKLILEKSYKS